MRLAALTFIGALAAGAVAANAAPVAPSLDAGQSPNIMQAWGGCGPGMHPVPGHWSRWRGGWVPPHCVPHYGGYRGGGYYSGGGYYGGGYPYGHRYRPWYGY
jgi:hypothetical protein